MTTISRMEADSVQLQQLSNALRQTVESMQYHLHRFHQFTADPSLAEVLQLH